MKVTLVLSRVYTNSTSQIDAVCAEDEADPALVFVLRQTRPLPFRCIFKQPPHCILPPQYRAFLVGPADSTVCFSIPRKEASIAAAPGGGVSLLSRSRSTLDCDRNTINDC